MQLAMAMILTIFIMVVSTSHSLPYPAVDSNPQEKNITIVSNVSNSTHTLDGSNSSIKVALPAGPDSESSAEIIIDDFQSDDNATDDSSDRLTIAIEIPKNKREVELLILPEEVVENEDYDGMALAESVVFRPLFAYRKSFEQRRTRG